MQISKNIKVVAVVLARMGSSRLKNKMLRKIDGKRSIDLFLNRLKLCKNVDQIILATSTLSKDNIFRKIAKNHSIKLFRGSEKDVVSRLSKSTKELKQNDIIVRANADNPIFMPSVVDQEIKNFKKSNYDLYSPFYKNKQPFGYSFVILKKSCVSKIDLQTKKSIYREHVENYCFDNKSEFKLLLTKIKKNSKLYYPNLSVTMDTLKDLKRIRKYYSIIKTVSIVKQPKYLIDYIKSK